MTIDIKDIFLMLFSINYWDIKILLTPNIVALFLVEKEFNQYEICYEI